MGVFAGTDYPCLSALLASVLTPSPTYHLVELLLIVMFLHIPRFYHVCAHRLLVWSLDCPLSALCPLWYIFIVRSLFALRVTCDTHCSRVPTYFGSVGPLLICVASPTTHLSLCAHHNRIIH